MGWVIFGKKNKFLVIIAFSILFVLIVNAAEEEINEGYNQSNRNSSYNETLELTESLANEASDLDTTIIQYEEKQINENPDNKNNDLTASNEISTNTETEERNEKKATSVTRSFGVSLTIAG